MAFPSSPTNNQVAVINNVTYTYNSTNGAWKRSTITAGTDATINTLVIQSGTDSTSTTSGALQVTGGAGIAKNLYVGSTIYGTATQAKYADLAENYTADAKYEPGTVVHFGGAAEVTQCNEDGCKRVAGVVSTAPAYLMNSELQGDAVVAVALQGRVPVRVVGNVAKGDMLVAAGNGAARAEANPQLGQVIGKSLQDFNGVEGVIEVVVGRI